MNRLESVCRVLRDLGIFFLGVSVITVAIDYLFIHPNPLREMEQMITKSYIEELQQNSKHEGNSIPVFRGHNTSIDKIGKGQGD